MRPGGGSGVCDLGFFGFRSTSYPFSLWGILSLEHPQRHHCQRVRSYSCLSLPKSVWLMGFGSLPLGLMPELALGTLYLVSGE